MKIYNNNENNKNIHPLDKKGTIYYIYLYTHIYIYIYIYICENIYIII